MIKHFYFLGSELAIDSINFEKRIKPILSLWRKLNEGVSLIQPNDVQNVQSDNTSNPWTSFVLSEFLMAKNLFITIHTTLSMIHVAIKDISSLTRDNLALIRVICENQVPLKWRQIWSGPKLIVDYIKAVVSRGVEAEKRYQVSNHLDFCDDIDFAKVYNVESFLAALKLKNAR